MFVLLFLVFGFVNLVASEPLKLDISTDGSYTVSIDGIPWLMSNVNSISFLEKGSWINNNNNLKLTQITKFNSSDQNGNRATTVLNWVTENNLHINSYFHEYKNGESGSDSSSSAILFEMEFVEGIESPSEGFGDPLSVASSFPDFIINNQIYQNNQLGYLSYKGAFFWTNSMGVYSSPSDFSDGYDGGPIVLFNNVYSRNQSSTGSPSPSTLIISPSNNFMSSSFYTQSGSIQCGLVGNVSNIPAGFTTSFIVYGGSQLGINQAFDQWGTFMRTKFNKERLFSLNDFTVGYLNYYTDNGAYYYYNQIPGQNYEETLIAVHKKAQSESIPYRVLQLDSWWYFKGISNGLKNWTANPLIFPNGLEYLHEQLQWPIVAHNRYWSANTDYWKKNGGAYDFLQDDSGEPIVVPTSSQFWYDLFYNSSKWGLSVYEQDWLYNEYEGISQMTSDINLARNWLMQMGDGASQLGLKIQYCMPYSRHVLQSLEVPAVTQIRSSDDYAPNNIRPQWRMGESSLLTWAVGSVPFKDTFWTTSIQPGNSYNQTGVDPALSIYIATLSMGPVAPGDGLDYMNKTLIMLSCDKNGRILKPDKPATSIDRNIVYKAFNKALPSINATAPSGHVFHTYTTIGDFRWAIILSIESLYTYSLVLSDLPFMDASLNKLIHNKNNEYVYYILQPSLHDYTSLVQVSVFINTSGKGKGNGSGGIPLDVSDTNTFQSVYMAPILFKGFALLGETNKIVHISKQRISSMEVYEELGKVILHLNGAESEVVIIAYARLDTDKNLWNTFLTSCALSTNGSAKLTVSVLDPPICMPY